MGIYLLCIAGIGVLCLVLLLMRHNKIKNYMQSNGFVKTKTVSNPMGNTVLYIDEIHKKWFMTAPLFIYANEDRETSEKVKGFVPLSKIYSFSDISEFEAYANSQAEMKTGFAARLMNDLVTDNSYEYIVLNKLSEKEVGYANNFHFAVGLNRNEEKQCCTSWLVVYMNKGKARQGSMSYKAAYNTMQRMYDAFAEMQKSSSDGNVE